MSLTITVRKSTETTGGDSRPLTGAGDNGNQEIDTKGEAEEALVFVTGDNLVAVLGGKTYTRQELVAIRDRNAQPAPTSDEKVPGEGTSHGILIGGSRTWGKGENGHTGNRLTLAWVPGFALSGSGPNSKDSKDKTSLTLDGILGLTFGGHSKSDYMTPGGEAVESNFLTKAITAGAHLRITPPFADKRIYFTPGARFHIGNFTTADGSEVSLPATCKAGDFGRGECEPNAGPRTGNAGTTGLWNSDLGAARGTSGLLLGLDLLAGVGVRIVKGESASVDAQGGFLFSTTKLAPSDGHGLTSSGIGGFLEVIARLGGTDTYVPLPPAATPPPVVPVPVPVVDKDDDGVPDAEDKCPDVKGTKENAGCPAYEAKVVDASVSVKSSGSVALQLQVSAKSEVSLQFKDAEGKLYNAGSTTIDKGVSVSEFKVPANLSAGKYKLVVTMKDALTKVEKVEEREISIVERVEWTVNASFAPGQDPAAQDVRVVGQPKLEGVWYVIAAIDKDGKLVGELKVTDKPGTIEDKKGTKITFKAPDINGKPVPGSWQKDINYRVALVNKDGNVLDVKSFTAAPLPTAPKGGGGRKRL